MDIGLLSLEIEHLTIETRVPACTNLGPVLYRYFHHVFAFYYFSPTQQLLIKWCMIFFSLREQRIFCYTPKKMLNSIDFYSKTFKRTFWIHCISALKRVKFMWFDLDIISFLWIELFIESDFVTLPISWRFSCLLPLHLSA